MDLNQATLIGNVARDPETKTLTSGQKVTKATLATNYAWKDKQTGEKKSKADFHTVVGWNGIGQNMADYLKKGDKVYFAGRINNSSWEGKDGQKKYYTDIIASKMIMLGHASKKEEVEDKVQETQIVEEDNGENPF
ncbi:MAG: single-stranded DNA-binding protein [Patescibacteria group bacterium]